MCGLDRNRKTVRPGTVDPPVLIAGGAAPFSGTRSAPQGGTAVRAAPSPVRALNTSEPLGAEGTPTIPAHRPEGIDLDGTDRALGDAGAAVITDERVDDEQPEEGVGLRERTCWARELAPATADARILEHVMTHRSSFVRTDGGAGTDVAGASSSRAGRNGHVDVLGVEVAQLAQAQRACPRRDVDPVALVSELVPFAVPAPVAVRDVDHDIQRSFAVRAGGSIHAQLAFSAVMPTSARRRRCRRRRGRPGPFGCTGRIDRPRGGRHRGPRCGHRPT